MNLKFFTLDEFNCSFTGENNMEVDFLKKLDELRDACGFPFVITSGFRSPTHPIEAKKEVPGTHSQGIAADIAVSNGAERFLIVKNAIKLNFSGIGIAKTFVHVDTRGSTPVMWTYS